MNDKMFIVLIIFLMSITFLFILAQEEKQNKLIYELEKKIQILFPTDADTGE